MWKQVYLVDIAIPRDSKKAIEKRTKYMDLKIDICRVWKSRNVFIIPFIVGALGCVPKELFLQLDRC